LIAKTLIGLANTNNDTGTGDVGDVISDQVVVTNTGDTRSPVQSVSDLLNGAALSGTQSSTLAVGGSETLTASYTLTRADVDGNKSVVNTTQVTDNQQVTQTSTAAVDQHPGISIQKQISIDGGAGQSAGTPSAFGVSHVSFGVIVTNTGDITDHVSSRTPPQAAAAPTATSRSGQAAAPVSILPLAVSQHPTSSPSPHRPRSAPRRTPPRCADATSLLSIGHTAIGRAEPTYGTITNSAP
jgi:transglutaminase/protease-like cytokinesis protein 3